MMNTNPKTLDEMIEALSQARSELGGDTPVVCTLSGDVEGRVGTVSVDAAHVVDGNLEMADSGLTGCCWLREREGSCDVGERVVRLDWD